MLVTILRHPYRGRVVFSRSSAFLTAVRSPGRQPASGRVSRPLAQRCRKPLCEKPRPVNFSRGGAPRAATIDIFHRWPQLNSGDGGYGAPRIDYATRERFRYIMHHASSLVRPSAWLSCLKWGIQLFLTIFIRLPHSRQTQTDRQNRTNNNNNDRLTAFDPGQPG